MKAVDTASYDAPMKRRRSMRRFAVLVMAGLLPVSLVAVAPAAANPGQRPPLPPPALAPVQADALTKALEQGHLSQAEYALHRARSIFTLGDVRDEFGSVARVDPHSATLILRDLALRLSSLDGEDRAIAADILARPTQGGSTDGTLEYDTAEATPIDSLNVRVHYVTSGEHASSSTYAAGISAIMEEVWAAEVELMGWREPKSDAAASDNGGNDKFDVYLGDVGAQSMYGYCTVDRGQTTYDQYSYCVLDNDFDSSQFGSSVFGLDAARVTAAHEFNHAIQFAYDITEDAWLFEATATWMEDQVFDDIDDNHQYLVRGPLGMPATPADTFASSGATALYQYGTFIWMRYLSEKLADPAAVRQIWEKADAKTAGANSMYSLEAIEAMLTDRGMRFDNSFADFAAVNAKASRFYEEGAGYEAVVAPVRTTSHTITTNVPVTGGATDVDHLSSRYISFTPGTDVASDASLTIAVDAGTSPMQEARVVTLAGTTMNVQSVDLTNGEGTITVPFGGQTEVVLVLTNASNRMNSCSRWSPGTYSCGGTPADDDRAYTYSAAVGSTAPDPGDPGGGGTDTQAPGLSGLKVKPSPAVRGKTAKLFFTVTEAARMRIAVMRSGKKYFAGTTSVTAPGTYYVKWPIPKKIPTGRYTLKVKATDAAGNSSRAKKVIKIVK